MIPEDRAALLQKTKTMIELERSLTATLEQVEPWLLQNAKRQLPNQPRVRPIPTTMEEVERVLAVARVLATRTSAPAGWNPAAPVVGFSTPNPMPHQLRGGALAALQLDRAKKTERLKKRQRKQEETLNKVGQVKENEDKEQQQQREEELSAERSKKDLASHPPQVTQARAPGVSTTINIKPQVDVSMNLSDSSSEEEDD